MFKIKNLFLGSAILLLLCLSIETNPPRAKESYESLGVFTDVLSIVENNYVDEEKVKPEELIYGAIKGVLSELDDPYTRFMPPKKYEETQVQTKGEFGGIGIEITLREEVLTIVAPIDDTPGYKAGLKAGDKITEIEGKSTKGITLEEAVDKLRGPKGSPVTFVISREEEEPFPVTIIRDIIEIKSVKGEMINEEIAYLRIASFSEHTARELDRILKELLKENKVKSLVLDLRNNPGGLLISAFEVSDKFLQEGVVVSTKGRIAHQNREYRARKQEDDFDLPLVVLINNGSASGAEIVAGAIKDTGRGVLLGTKSFGKGSVQTIYPLSDNSGIALTTAKYFTPSGICIHEKGIMPQIVVEPRKFTKEEIEQFKKLNEGKLIKGFVDKHNPYTEEDLDKFLKELSDKEINLEKTIIKSRVDRELRIANNEKEPLFDLEIDNQLKRAVELLVALPVFSRSH